MGSACRHDRDYRLMSVMSFSWPVSVVQMLQIDLELTWIGNEDQRVLGGGGGGGSPRHQ